MNRSIFLGQSRLTRTASAAALATALMMSAQASAQNADTEAAVEEEQTDDIVVTGFAASLETATREKRNADQIIESVSAEDIGKLPDASIAESIARLPGLTSQRLNGRANVISIRGLGPDLSTTLLNGREQTTTGDNRAVEFDQYPSEIINQVVVYKSPTASLIGQGLAGTVDIRTIRPLETNRSVLSFGARGVYSDLGALNAGSSDTGYRVNGTYVDQFADDTIGIALAASYVDEPYQIQQFNAWGYAGNGTTADPFRIGGNRSFVQSTSLKRFGVVGTVQWAPTDTVMLTVDGLYSDFQDDQILRGIELPLGFGGGFGVTGDAATATIVDGFATAGRFSNVRGVVRNDPQERNAELYSFGFNAKYDGNDGWSAWFDFGYSSTDRNELIFESYSGTGFNGDDTGNGAAGTIDFVSSGTGTRFTPSLDYSNPAIIRLTDPLGWGGGVVPQAGYFNNRIVEDELYQYRAEVAREFEGSFISSVQFGLGYTDRTKSLTPDEFFIRLPNGATSLAIPQSALLAPTNLGFLGLGPIVSYDPRQLLADGVLVTQPNTANDVLQKAYSVSEGLLQTYLQANIDHDIGNVQLKGNFGVQVVFADQSSTGIFFPPGAAQGASQPLTLGDAYTDVLPSLNLSLNLPNDWVVRLAAAREIQRPRIDDTRVALGYGFNQTQGVIEGGGGNPFLQPFRAWAVDLNVEKYFGNGGYISVQGFYKDLEDFVFNGQFAFDFAALPRPTNFPAGAPTLGFLNVPVNTRGGYIWGGEISSNIPFGSIVPVLDGFGFTGGVGYTESSVENDRGETQQIIGYSKWTANGTLYFEKDGFSLRGSARYRGPFLAELSVFGGNRGTRNAVEELIFDGQVGYDFGEIGPLSGLSIYFQAQNLTNERFSTIQNGDPRQVIDYQTYGRRFYLGASIKF
jgi:iron complex outermembrane recepter protein